MALALAPAVAIAAAPSPDAELVAIGAEAVPLIAEYEHTFATWRALPQGHPNSLYWADAGDAPYHRLDELSELASELRATTLEGFMAKARLLQHHLRTGNRMNGQVRFNSPEEEMAWELVHDSGRVGGMSGRRGFLAWVDGITLTGSAVKVQADAKPTLILPARPALLQVTQLPTEFPLLSAEPTQMDAFINIKRHMDDRQFLRWMECGLTPAAAE